MCFLSNTFAGSSNEQAKQALEACDWNLEMAVNLQMDIGHSAPSVESPAGEAVPSDLLRSVGCNSRLDSRVDSSFSSLPFI